MFLLISLFPFWCLPYPLLDQHHEVLAEFTEFQCFIIKDELGHLGNPKTRTTNDNYINQFCSRIWEHHNLSVCVSFNSLNSLWSIPDSPQKGALGAFLPRTRRFQQFREVGPTGRSQVANWGSGPTSRDRDCCWLLFFCMYSSLSRCVPL